ncbi:hypothetical protein C8J56DRAFT_968871 [Mycena floridula]|nr:hypothetical protein C8J56DRAFT_968871 [Mycena floridula]
MSSAAEKFKESGVLLYKAGKFSEAVAAFRKASQLEPKVPFENGEYTSTVETCTQVLDMVPTTDPLHPKVLARKSKALLFLSHNNDAYSSTAFEFLKDDALRTKALHRQSNSKTRSGLVNQRLTSLPRYRPSPENLLEYYVTGQDEVTSMFRGQNTGSGTDMQHMRMPRDGSPFNFSAMFCGIGDARHLYASLLDAGQDFPKSKGKKIKIHFTAVDIHPTALARDLLVLFALQEISTFDNHSTGRSKELLVMLHYLFWAGIMPPFARRALDETVETVYTELLGVTSKSEPLDLSWLYIDLSTCQRIRTSLQWWRTEGKTALSYDSMLPPPRDNDRKQFLQSLRLPEMRSQVQAMARDANQTVKQHIEYWETMDEDQFHQIFDSQQTCPKVATLENMAYPSLRVLVPPAGCGEPNIVEKVFRAVREGGDIPSPEIVEEIHEKYIKPRWSINYTRLDKAWLMYRNHREQDPFSGCKGLFPSAFEHLNVQAQNGSLFDVSARFFSLAALGIGRLGESLKIELILGDGYDVMDKIRLKTLARPDFPVLFDRIHASNVPDYAGGHLATFTSAMPILKPHRLAYFTTCNLLNANIWEGGMADPKFYDLSLSSQIYTYDAAFGVKLVGKALSPVEYHSFKCVPRVANLLNREDITSVATACFIRTVLPAKYTTLHNNPSLQAREVLNVHSFFRALEIWKGLGYSKHLLSDLVERILDNRLDRSAIPHEKAPAPVVGRTNEKMSLCTLPFLAEFEVAAALWEPRLFPIVCSALPAIEEIRRYSITIPLKRLTALMKVSPTHNVLLLAFGLPKEMDATSLDFRQSLVGSSRRWTSSVQFISTFIYNPQTHICSVLLSKSRAQSFLDQGFEAALLNTAGWKLQSARIPCAGLREVGDLDNWDEDIDVPDIYGRPLSDAQIDAWTSQMMPSIPGMPNMDALMNNMAGLAGLGGMGGIGGLGELNNSPGCPTQ